jgi:beta-glucosidase
MAKTKPLYRNPKAKVESRVKDLMRRMTLEEKVAQLGSFYTETFIENGKFSTRKARKLLKKGVGQFTRIGGSVHGFTPGQSAVIANSLQKFLKEETRLGIPAMVHEECLAGLLAKGATSYPQAIALASTWDPDLVQTMTSEIGQLVSRIGSHHGLAPVLDVSREPRWGRVEETFGEDEYLVARMGVSYVRGLQGKNFRNRITATLKHFAGHGYSEGGRNCAPVHLGMRELRETFLFPFEAVIKLASPGSIMNAYHELDGVPCGISKVLLTDILRDEWKFNGLVVSDYNTLDNLENLHFVAGSREEAAVVALEAGLDIELPRREYFGQPLIDAVRKGLIKESFVDRAAGRILRLKFLLGIFDYPFVNENIPVTVYDTPENRRLARRAADEVIILLKNEKKVLPLSGRVRNIAVIGPNAASTKGLPGDYDFHNHYKQAANAKGHAKLVSVLEGIKNRAPKGTAVRFAEGCGYNDNDTSGFAGALKIAKQSDVIIAAMGEHSGLFGRGISGEGDDRSNLDLPGVQEQLIKELCKLKKPVIVVLFNGRPLSIPWVKENCAAIIEAWYPGEEGGSAIAGVLFGDTNPGGKLTITFPKDIGQIPMHYSRKRSSVRDYVDMNMEPLFPFGHGLSYTTFKYSGLKISPKNPDAGDKIEISFRLKNTGRMTGDEVVQLYVRDEIASVARPGLELKGFRRVTLGPNREKRIKFTIHPHQLAFYGMDMKLVIEKGEYKVFIGSSSRDIRLEGKFFISKTSRIPERRVFFSETEEKTA